jgi:hypothetical protein
MTHTDGIDVAGMTGEELDRRLEALANTNSAEEAIELGSGLITSS